MALSVDTNIVVYSLNRDSDVHQPARAFMEELSLRTDVVIAEFALVELYLLIRNPTVFAHPYNASDAASVCERLRSNPNWQVVECRPVMSDLWPLAARQDFPRRRILDARLAFTLLAAGVTELATRNTKDFDHFGFTRVFDPLGG